MSYCLNPKCPHPSDPANEDRQICLHCGSEILLQDRYRIIRPMGGGGFGRTFEVIDHLVPPDHSIERVKVLKVLLKNDPKAVSLFQQEAQALSRLTHPGIPKVEADGYFTFWAPNSEEPLHCLVMEKIEGSNLKVWLKQRRYQPIGQEQAIDWLKQLSEILIKVHDQQYFHRDIKPLNIMIRPNGQLVLIDFGTAREVTKTYLAKVGNGQNVTGIVSPGYTPPEQANGKAVPQSDFFALGRTFVYLVTGKSPTDFPENPRTGKLIWRDKAPQISKPLADVIDYLMAPFPGNRPQSAQMILRCIEEVEPKLYPTQHHLHSVGRGPNAIAPSTTPASPPPKDSHRSNGSGNWRSPPPDQSKLSNSGISRLPGRLALSDTTQSRSQKTSQKFQLSWFSLVGVLLLAVVGTQVYGYWRYGFFPANPAALIANLPSSRFLERNLNNVGFVNAVAISPMVVKSTTESSQVFASASFGTIRLWNVQTGKLLRHIAGHSNWVTSLAISPNGQLLASGSEDQTLKIWTLNGQLRHTLFGHTAPVRSVAISPDNQLVASASDDKTIKIWHLQRGILVRTLWGHAKAVNSLAISPNGQLLVSASDDKTIKIWHLPSGKLIRTLSGHLNSVQTVAISPDGQWLASGSADNTIQIWNLNTGTRVRVLSGDASWVRCVIISPDGELVASASSTIQIWSVASGQLLQTLRGHSRFVSAIALSPDGETLISGSHDQTIKIWHLP